MFWLLAGILALGLGGAAVLLLGLRGRRIDDHPICRRCGFDLIGQAPRASEKGAGEGDVTTTDSPRCSECGADLTRRRAIRLGERRRRPTVATAGALALLISLGATGAISWGAATEYDWNTVKPVWLLARELQSTDSAVATAATDELRRRLPGNGLAPMRDGQRDARAAERLGRRILDYQGDTSRPWNPGAGEIFERMWQMKLLPEEMFHQYVRQSSPVSVHVRPRIVQGEPPAVRFDVQQRAGRGGLVCFRGRVVDLRIGDEPVAIGAFRMSVLQGQPQAPWQTPHEPVVAFELLNHLDLVYRRAPYQPPGLDLPPGRWPLRLRLVVKRDACAPDEFEPGREVTLGSPFVPTAEGDSLLDLLRYADLWQGDALPESLPSLELVEVETEIDIVPPGERVVDMVRGADAEAVADSMIASVLLEQTDSFEPSANWLQLRLTIRRSLPLDIAYDITVSLPSGDRHLGSLVQDIEAAAFDWTCRIPLGDTPRVKPGDFLRFTFTPNPDAAARLAGIEKIAGEPFEVELIVPERILWGPPSPP